MNARIFLASCVYLLGAMSGVSVAQQTQPIHSNQRMILPDLLADIVVASHHPEEVARILGLDGPRRSGQSGRGILISRSDANHGSRRTKGPQPGEVVISGDPDTAEVEADVAFSPRHRGVLVVAYVAPGSGEDTRTLCMVRRSYDTGRTWSKPVPLPIRRNALLCGSPALAYSANGHWLYAAYDDVRNEVVDEEELPGDGYRRRTTGDSDIAVSVSRDDGLTWSHPVPALDGAEWAATVTCLPASEGLVCETSDVVGGANYGRASLAAPRRPARAVYVAGTRFSRFDPAAPASAIAFTRSKKAPHRWVPPIDLDTTADVVVEGVVQGASVAADQRGKPLIAWYHPSNDGFRVGAFEIRTRYSSDLGDTWAPLTTAVVDGYEANRFLGPDGLYQEWWTTMFPDLVVDSHGRAHVVYGHDPVPGSTTNEEGDVRYVSSAGPPYEHWAPPVTVNDDGLERAQGLASLSIRELGGTTILDVIWEDTRLDPDVPTVPPDSSNLYYDIFHAAKLLKDQSWSANRRVSEESSIQVERRALGRTGLVWTGNLLFGVWTTRRQVESVTDVNSDILGRAILWSHRRR